MTALKKTIATIFISGALFAVVHFFGGQLGMIGTTLEQSYPGIISTSSWVSTLEQDPTAHGYSIYGILEERETDAAVEHAFDHIHSKESYLWLNAASYLGSRDRKEAIPYPIKSIRHTARRSVSKRTDTLTRITGQNFGTNFDDWRLWYEEANPEQRMDWNSSPGHNPLY